MTKKTALQGKDLMIWIGDTAINLSESCSINIQAVTIDPETKDDAINGFDIDKFTWTVQNDSQLTVTGSENVAIVKTMLAKTEVEVKIGIPTNKSDDGVPEVGWTAPTSGFFKGKAKITAYTGTGAVGSKAKQSITLTGCSKLEVVD